MANFLAEQMSLASQRVKFIDSRSVKGPSRQAFSRILPSTSPWESESRFDAIRDSGEEQALHYRGRVYSAINVTINRILRQPIIVARKLRKGGKRKAWAEKNGLTLKARLEKGDINFDQVPRWVCKSASHAEDLEVLDDHPILDVLHDPNPLMVRTNLWQSTIACLDITGHSYWVMDRDPDMIVPVPSTWVTPVLASDGLSYRHYKIKPPHEMGEGIIIPAENVARFYNSDPFSLFGVFSPLQAMAATVLSDEAIEIAQEANFRNSMKPAMGIMTGDELGKMVKLQPNQRADIQSWVRREFAGAVRNGTPMVFDSLIRDAKALFPNPNEMDYLSSSKITKANIYEGYATSPIIAGMVEGANRAGSAVAEFNFAANRANPMASMISEVMTEKVAPFFNDSSPEKLFVWIEEIKPHDPDHQRNLWRDIMGEGGATIDEHRKYLGLPPLPNGLGRALIRRVNTVEIPIDGGEPTVYTATPPQPEEPEPTNQDDSLEDSSSRLDE